MGEILPDGTIQGYTGFCSKCKSTISKNIQGDEIGTHVCEVKKQPLQQQEKNAHTLLCEAVQHLFDVRKEKGSTNKVKDAWNLLAVRLWDCKNKSAVQPSTPIASEGEEIKDPMQSMPVLVEAYADNGEFSHWRLVDRETSDLLWTECPEEDSILYTGYKHSLFNREEGRELQKAISDFWNFGYADYDLSTSDKGFNDLDNEIVDTIFRAGWEARSHLSPSSPPLEQKELSDDFLRHLVDVVWQTAKEDEQVPSTDWSNRMIYKAKEAFKL